MAGKTLNELLGNLQAPFAEVDWKVQSTTKDKSRGQVVPYIDARSVAERLDEAVGPEGWQDSYDILLAQGDSFVVRCRLSVLGVSKEDVGEGDSLKAAFSDALKRAAVKFGVGRYLYRMPDVWVEIEEGRFIPRSTVRALDAAYRRFIETGEWRLDAAPAKAPAAEPAVAKAAPAAPAAPAKSSNGNDLARLKGELAALARQGAKLPAGWERVADAEVLRRLVERHKAN
ncbi:MULTISPECIES: Rad52/Rad22 family DNA repair protein [unclassified Meiothermus]|uniref:Rad52/Rad22 family DNA repair protein n=1 Tax=unclassified Meiothermus TaxID=370471 RepID=UPI0010215D7E|nr:MULTISPECIES: Rad52/Rad22 family DNA repair protein [unclassified Meiothermus]RYM37181.1 hypothetical protein EWH23_06810 [Meiothermus sp. PNK-Is4]